MKAYIVGDNNFLNMVTVRTFKICFVFGQIQKFQDVFFNLIPYLPKSKKSLFFCSLDKNRVF